MLAWEAHRTLSLMVGDSANIKYPADMLNNGVRYSFQLRKKYLLLGAGDYFNAVYKTLLQPSLKKTNAILYRWFAPEVLRAQDVTLLTDAIYILSLRNMETKKPVPIFSMSEENMFNNSDSSQIISEYATISLPGPQLTLVDINNTVSAEYLPGTIQQTTGSPGTDNSDDIYPLMQSIVHSAHVLTYAALRAYQDDQEISSPERLAQMFLNLPQVQPQQGY